MRIHHHQYLPFVSGASESLSDSLPWRHSADPKLDASLPLMMMMMMMMVMVMMMTIMMMTMILSISHLLSLLLHCRAYV
jgi:hypothetical protein